MPEPSSPAGTPAWTRRAVLLAGGLLVAGCSGPRRPTIQSEDYESENAVRNRLRALLERRAKALMDKDERGYLADLDPSNDELVRYEKLVFGNLRQFELEEVRYITERLLERPGADGELQVGPVIRVTKLSADAGPGDVAPAESFLYRIKDGDKPVISGIERLTRENLEKAGADVPLADAPWNTDELTVKQVGEKVWLVGDGTVTAELGRYAAATERELGVVERLWGDRLTYPGHVLFFTRDAGNYRSWFGVGSGDNFNPRNLGFQIRLRGVRKDGLHHQDEYAASRIVVNLDNHQGSDPSRTLRHELAHAVTARATMTDYGDWGPPTWAIEGFARYIETVGDPARAAQLRAEVAAGVRAGRFKGAPPASDTFYGRDILFNYALGSTVFSLAERLKGREAAVELYARIIQRPDSGDFLKLPIFDRISRDVLGISAGAFRSRWNGFVRGGG